jgi:hypothetical protein
MTNTGLIEWIKKKKKFNTIERKNLSKFYYSNL